MPYPVDYISLQESQLRLLGRQRHSADQLLYVQDGSLLLRLGRDELVLRQGESFWLPAECLHGLTLFKDTHLVRLQFSVRVRQSRPQSAGYLQPLPLLPPLIQRLGQLQGSTEGIQWQGQGGRLLRVVADLLPELRLSPYSPLLWPAAIPGTLQAIMQGRDLSAIANQANSQHQLSPRQLLDEFKSTLGTSLIEWQEQWQLYQTHLHLKQGLGEEAAYRQAGFASDEQYQQCRQRYLQAPTDSGTSL